MLCIVFDEWGLLTLATVTYVKVNSESSMN